MSSMDQPRNTKGQLSKVNSVLGPAFVGVDTAMRVKDGEQVPVALGKALIMNAAWGLVPGGVVGGLALTAGMVGAQMIPEIGRAIENQRNQINSKVSNFASANYFQETEAQQAMLQQGFGQIQMARQHAVRAVSNHARNAQRVY